MLNTLKVQLCGIDTVDSFEVAGNPQDNTEAEVIIEAVNMQSAINLDTHDVFFHYDTDPECLVMHIRHLFDDLSEATTGICLHALLKSPNTQLAEEAGIVLRLDSSPAPAKDHDLPRHIQPPTWHDPTALLLTPPDLDEELSQASATKEPSIPAQKREKIIGCGPVFFDSDDSILSHITVAGYETP